MPENARSEARSTFWLTRNRDLMMSAYEQAKDHDEEFNRFCLRLQ